MAREYIVKMLKTICIKKEQSFRTGHVRWGEMRSFRLRILLTYITLGSAGVSSVVPFSGFSSPFGVEFSAVVSVAGGDEESS